MLRRPAAPLREFLATEAGGGLLLLLATVAALAWANSPWSSGYADLWGRGLRVGPSGWAVDEDLRHWVNDALMSLFFLLIGLEIKRELVDGELRDRRAAALPALAALGGMVLPALLYLAVAGGGEAARGWGIPMATDIAFAVGVLALLGTRAPSGLRVFLLALAIIDDIGAIVVIAVFYSSGLGIGWLVGAVVAVAAISLLRPAGVVCLVLGVAAWYLAYRSGVHPTIAAVAVGLVLPIGMAERLEHRLHPWSSFLVVPLFALANAGVALGASALGDALRSRVTWAVIVGLVVGKTLGISGAGLAGRRARIGALPDGAGPRHLLGAGAIGGIGFTVALFVTGLAFPSATLRADATIGILAGSLVAGLLGSTWLVVAGA